MPTTRALFTLLTSFAMAVAPVLPETSSCCGGVIAGFGECHCCHAPQAAASCCHKSSPQPSCCHTAQDRAEENELSPQADCACCCDEDNAAVAVFSPRRETNSLNLGHTSRELVAEYLAPSHVVITGQDLPPPQASAQILLCRWLK